MQDYQELKERIKEHEGFRNTIYKDSLNFATIGYGHLIVDGDPYEEGQEYSKVILDQQFDEDFDIALSGAEKILGTGDMNFKAKCVIIEMVFQLGIGGVSKFKKTLKVYFQYSATQGAGCTYLYHFPLPPLTALCGLISP